MLSKLITRSLFRQGKYLFFQNRYAHSLFDNPKNSHRSEIVLKNNLFEKNTFRGKEISRDLIKLLFSDPDLVYKGMSAKEIFVPINTKLLGLIGPLSLLPFSKDKKVTEKYLGARRTSNGIYSSPFLEAIHAAKFAALIPEQQMLMIIDLKNIPTEEQDLSAHTLSSGTGKPGNSSEEATVSSIHISAILKRASREGGNLKVEYNPLYVDQQILSKELNSEYTLLLKKFYAIIPIARQNLDHPEIKQFKEILSSFYEKYIEELKVSKTHAQAIRDEINKVTINAETLHFEDKLSPSFKQ